MKLKKKERSLLQKILLVILALVGLSVLAGVLIRMLGEDSK